MASRRVVTLVCDQCGGETDDVLTHRVTVDGQTVDAEMCAKCWGKLLTAFGGFVHAGREVRKARIARTVEFPGVEWKFTHHALQRMGERKLNPKRVVQVIEDPEITRPGTAANLEVCTAYGVKVVIDRDRASVVTVAHIGEDDDELASTA